MPKKAEQTKHVTIQFNYIDQVQIFIAFTCPFKEVQSVISIIYL